MTVVVDTSVLIDVLRGVPAAAEMLREEARRGPLHGSEITRLEVLAGMRVHERAATLGLLDVITWHALDRELAELAGDLGRRWLPGNRGIDSADLAIAATAVSLDSDLLTLNVKHFPMFPGLRPPY